MRVIIDQLTIECRVGNIARQADVDAVVNAANAELRPGGGVAGAIHGTAGPRLAEACRKFAPIVPGQAVATDAFDLPNRYVVHCLGPVYGRDKPEAELLRQCYQAALDIAEDFEVTSIAFPAISTGAFGYPFDKGAEVACSTVVRAATSLGQVKLVRFVLHRQTDFEIFCASLVRATSGLSAGSFVSMSH